MTTATHLPAAPLLDIIDRRIADLYDRADYAADVDDHLVACVVGVSLRTVSRWRRTGVVPRWSADRSCVALGLTPHNVWSCS